MSAGNIDWPTKLQIIIVNTEVYMAWIKGGVDNLQKFSGKYNNNTNVQVFYMKISKYLLGS